MIKCAFYLEISLARVFPIQISSYYGQDSFLIKRFLIPRFLIQGRRRANGGATHDVSHAVSKANQC